MIKGGVNAGGKTSGLLCGYSESYLPCRATIMRADLKAAIEQTTPTVLQYAAYAYVRNVADTAWITLGTVSYFQIVRSMLGDGDSATVTVQQPETWSAYKAGGTYEDVLKPSNRGFRIKAGLVIGSTEYLVTVFLGHVTSYDEPWGANGGAILLGLSDNREIASRVEVSTPAFTAASRYRMAVNAAKLMPLYTGATWYLSPIPRFAEETGGDPDVDGASNVLDAVNSMAAGEALSNVTGAGNLVVGTEDDGQGDVGSVFAYSDTNIITLTRRSDNYGGFNVVRTYGYDGTGAYVTDEVTDAADIAKRGRVVYPPGLWGARWLSIAYANSTGTEFLAQSLRGTIDVEVPFNPYLMLLQRISLSSTKASIAAGYGRVRQLQHQYAPGRAVTYMQKLVLA
jgi:hypothetical protein